MNGGIWNSGFGIGKRCDRPVIRRSKCCSDQEIQKRERDARIERFCESLIPNPKSLR